MSLMKKLSLSLFSILILFLTTPSFTAEIKEITRDGKKLEVIDGDTIKIDNFKIRLHGIDAPEMGQICLDKKKEPYDCGLYSKRYLKKLIGKREIVCVYNSLDVYKRILGTCYRGSRNPDTGIDGIMNLNYMMVATGKAVAFIKYSTRYFKAEKFARRNNSGIWQGKFETPWEWRKKNK